MKQIIFIILSIFIVFYTIPLFAQLADSPSFRLTIVRTGRDLSNKKIKCYFHIKCNIIIRGFNFMLNQ